MYKFVLDCELIDTFEDNDFPIRRYVCYHYVFLSRDPKNKILLVILAIFLSDCRAIGVSGGKSYFCVDDYFCW